MHSTGPAPGSPLRVLDDQSAGFLVGNRCTKRGSTLDSNDRWLADHFAFPSIAACSAFELTFARSTTLLASLRPGQILVHAPRQPTPAGLLVSVTRVTRGGDGQVIVSGPAGPLADLMPEGDPVSMMRGQVRTMAAVSQQHGAPATPGSGSATPAGGPLVTASSAGGLANLDPAQLLAAPAPTYNPSAPPQSPDSGLCNANPDLSNMASITTPRIPLPTFTFTDTHIPNTPWYLRGHFGIDMSVTIGVNLRRILPSWLGGFSHGYLLAATVDTTAADINLSVYRLAAGSNGARATSGIQRFTGINVSQLWDLPFQVPLPPLGPLTGWLLKPVVGFQVLGGIQGGVNLSANVPKGAETVSGFGIDPTSDVLRHLIICQTKSGPSGATINSDGPVSGNIGAYGPGVSLRIGPMALAEVSWMDVAGFVGGIRAFAELQFLPTMHPWLLTFWEADLVGGVRFDLISEADNLPIIGGILQNILGPISGTKDFTVVYPFLASRHPLPLVLGAPQITSLNCPAAFGKQVTITGTNFAGIAQGAGSVYLATPGGTPKMVTFDSWVGGTIKFTLPRSGPTGNWTVWVVDGGAWPPGVNGLPLGASNGASCDVQQALQSHSTTPTTAPGGHGPPPTTPSCSSPYPLHTTGPGGCGFSTSGWWTNARCGLEGREIWTWSYVPGQAHSIATWNFTGLGSGSWFKVYAYIPNCGANATAAHYTISDASGSYSTTVDQDRYGNAYVYLGYADTAYGATSVKVQLDDTGNPRGRYVGADAVELVPTRSPCGRCS